MLRGLITAIITLLFFSPLYADFTGGIPNRNAIEINPISYKKRIGLSPIFIETPQLKPIAEMIQFKTEMNLQTLEEIISKVDYNLPLDLEKLESPMVVQESYDYVCTFALTKISDTKLSYHVNIYDAFSLEIIASKSYIFHPSSIDTVANKLSNFIYKIFTKKNSFFGMKMLYISKGVLTQKHPRHRIATLNFTTNEIENVVSNENVILSPEYHNGNILYSSFDKSGLSSIKLFDTKNQEARSFKFSNFDIRGKITYSATINNDSSKLAFVVSHGGKTDIYLADIKTMDASLLTDKSGISTSPSFSSDGKSLAYIEDKLGVTKIITVNLEDRTRKQISHERGMYLSPSFSPDNTKVSFAKILRGKFYIGFIDLETGKEYLLYSNYVAEDPTWIDNDSLIFTARSANEDFAQPFAITIGGTPQKIQLFDNVSQVSVFYDNS